jgi:hypothetical protein
MRSQISISCTWFQGSRCSTKTLINNSFFNCPSILSSCFSEILKNIRLFLLFSIRQFSFLLLHDQCLIVEQLTRSYTCACKMTAILFNILQYVAIYCNIYFQFFRWKYILQYFFFSQYYCNIYFGTSGTCHK